MNPVKRTVQLFKERGLYQTVRVILRHIHKQLPKRQREYVDVKVKDGILLDPILPWQKDSNPHHESGIISGIEQEVKQGDDVVIVGGGKGVTAVKAAEKVGHSGNVEIYEGGYKSVEKSKLTARLNNTEDIININHAIVGPAISITGEEKNATNINPSELPECDVLELDCEGAEIPIIKNLDISPRVILVESHGMYNSPSEDVIKSLENKRYNIVSKNIADKGMKELHSEYDVFAITARNEQK